MSYGATQPTFGTVRNGRDMPLKFSWQSASGPNPVDIPADYIVHKMRAALRPERTLASAEFRIIRAIEVFLFIAFFPLGFLLNLYNKVFGPSIAMSGAALVGWCSIVATLLPSLL